MVFVLLFRNEINLFALADVGTATSYNPPYTPTRCYGDSQDQFPPGNLFVAVNEGLLDNGAACGRQYRLRCLSGNNKPCKVRTIDVKVVDYFPKSPCPSTIILSNEAFAAVSSSSLDDRINIEYIEIWRFNISGACHCIATIRQ